MPDLGPRNRNGWLTFFWATVFMAVVFFTSLTTGHEWVIYLLFIIVPAIGWYTQRKK